MAEDSINPLTSQPATPPTATPPPDDGTSMINPASAVDPSQSAAAANMLAPGSASDAQPPSTPTPPDVGEHLNWIGRALHAVSTALGGGTTLKMIPDKDGSMTLQAVPATETEKWGRIAAAALGGAAQGLANSQGPGGAARAAAAGTQYGLQKPQQDKQEAQQSVDFSNKQLLAKANRIHLTQETYMLAQQGKLNDLQFNQASADVLGKYLKTLQTSPNAEDLGPIDPSDPNAAMNVAKKNPGAMDAFLGKSNQVLRPVVAPDHKLHMVLTDRSWEERRNTQPMDSFYIGKDDDGKPTLKSEIAPVNADTVENINNHNIAMMKNFYGNLKDFASAEKDEKGPDAKPLDTSGKTLDAWRQETNPTKKAGLWQQYKTQLSNEETLKGKEGAGEGNPLLSTLPKGATPISSDDQGFIGQITKQPTPQGQQVLDGLPAGQANLVRRFGNYLADESKELPRGKERGPFLELVSSVYPDWDSAHYESRRDVVKSATGDGKIANSRNALNLTIQHMGEMWDRMQQVNPGEYPATNWAQQQYHMTAGFGDKEVKGAYGGYEDANEGVASEMARVFKGGAPTQTEVNQYRQHAGINEPRSAQEGGFRTRAHMLASRLGIINRQLQEGLNTPGKNYQLLTPESIDTLKKLPGGDEILSRAGVAATPAPAAAGAAPAARPAPAAATPKGVSATADGKGATWDANVWRNVHPHNDAGPMIQWAKTHNFKVVNE
jgi:hypothetical protein